MGGKAKSMGLVKEDNKSKIQDKKFRKIYILHGWTYSVEKWKPFIQELESKGFDCELLKIPGLTAKIDRPWNLDDYVNWIASILPKNQEFVLLGHSNGGRIAAKFASQYPDRVKHLILIDAAGIYDKSLVLQTKRILLGSAAKIGKRLLNLQALRKIVYKVAREHDYETADPVMRATMRNLIRADLTEDFKKIQTPTTIIWGKLDKATPLSHGKKINMLIPHSKLFIINDARHSPMFTNVRQTVLIVAKELS